MAMFGSLFGQSKRPWWLAQSPDQQPGTQAAPAQGFFETGKPHGKDWLGLALGAIGDAFAQQSGGQPVMTQTALATMLGARQARQAQAQKQATVDALVKKGVSADQAAILATDPKETSAILGGQYEYHAPTADQQNFGAYDAMDPETKARFSQYKDVTDPRYTNTAAGTQFVPRTSPGTLPPGYNPTEWEPVEGPGAAPTMQTTPSPALGQNGLPASLTPQQYQAIVAAKGKAATDAWLAQHPEIKVGGG